MTNANIKRLAVKFAGTNRPTETLNIAPGTLTRDVMRELALDPAGFHLVHGTNPDLIYGLDDVIYARVQDGDLVYATARVEAGVA